MRIQRVSVIVALASAVGLVCGCGQNPSPSQSTSKTAAPSQPAQAVQSQPDPVASLKVHVEALKRHDTFISVSYDVQKSDSLVSPYMGVITSVKRDDAGPVQGKREDRYTLAFQEGHWVLKSRERRNSLLMGGSWQTDGWKRPSTETGFYGNEDEILGLAK